MQKTISVRGVEIIKKGTNPKTKKDWTLYKVQCDGDDEMKEFSTFNSQYQNAEGQRMILNVEYDSKWKNWKEISVQQEAENSKHEEIMNGLRKIYELLEEIKTPIIDQDNTQSKN